ncbi:MAG: RagB/SusD family nutrient uptake outer membrane protein [Prevotella sp.]|nr:RagB/SusD family nutrient uptake outer membrane protein [Prevotella sp.]
MKINNKIANAVIAVVALFSTGCSSSFLDEELTTSYSTQYFETEEGLESLAISLYGHIRWLFAYGWSYPMTLYGVDEFGIGTDGVNEMWNTYDYRLAATSSGPANYTDNADLWDELYYGIASANTLIASLDKITDESKQKRIKAMAYFLRGFNFYKLTAQYGWCVLQTEPANGVIRSFKKSSPEECWAQTISDLRTAYETFEGEDFYYGKGMTWTKATAAHYLAKALLFRASERNDSWNSSYKSADLQEALACCNYVISARSLEADYNDLYNNWTGVDCDIEKSDEILMAATWNDDYANTGGRFGNNTSTIFSPQFSNFASTTTNRGAATGGKDFQRLRPTEYTYAVFDHVNDARLWKSFKTVYGANLLSSPPTKSDGTEVELGEPAVVFILNTQDDHTYDNFTFGAARYQEDANFVDVAGRLPDWTPGERQTQYGETTFSGKPGQAVLNSWILYQNGTYVGNNFGSTATSSYGSWQSNMFCGVCKSLCGQLESNSGYADYTGDYSARDVTIARVGDTYLMRAEIYVRLGDYSSAMNDLNVIRRRGAWKEGENRSYQIDGTKGFENNTSFYSSYSDQYENWNLNMNTYYLSNPDLEVTTASTEDAMTLTSFPSNLPAVDEAIMTKLGVTSDYDRALNFILNERTRELLGEYQRWETLSRTGTLIKRAKAFNPDVVNITEGKSELRPIPQSFIDSMLHEDGTNLSDDEKAEWQNPGY